MPKEKKSDTDWWEEKRKKDSTQRSNICGRGLMFDGCGWPSKERWGGVQGKEVKVG